MNGILQPATSTFWQMLWGETTFQAMIYCYQQGPNLAITMATGDGLVCIAYLLMAIFLAMPGKGVSNLPSWLRIMFSAFLGLGGLEHLLMLFNIWHGLYWIEAIVKNLAGIVAMLTTALRINLTIRHEVPGAVQPIELDGSHTQH